MHKGAHAFLRGSCHLFYEDWSGDSRLGAPLVWACGDLHIENFGTYRGDNRLLYFDIADCDEAALAPCTWDLARLLTSVLVSGQEVDDRRTRHLALCETLLEAYCWALRDGKARWVERAVARGFIKVVMQRVECVDAREFIAGRTVRGAGRVLDVGGKHALPIGKGDRRRIEAFMQSFAERQVWPTYFAALDIARRLAGTGSLGIERYTILVHGGGTLSTRFLLDLKAAVSSALDRYVDAKQPRWKSEAQRVVDVQRRVQAIAPALLQAVSI